MPAAATSALTISCPVRLDLTGGGELDAIIYLPTDAARPGGITPVEAVLDDGRDFIPIGVEGGSALLSRRSVRVLEMAADGPGAPEVPAGGGTFDIVSLRLDSGREVSGVLRAYAPADSMRMSDFFNIPGRFLALGAGERVLLVSKDHIVLASF